MLKHSKLSDILWAQGVHTKNHILNRGILISNSDKIPYELWKGRMTNENNFIVFWSKCYIKREDEKLGKFDSRVEKGILFGYSNKRKSYKFFSPRLKRIVEIFNVTIGGKWMKDRRRKQWFRREWWQRRSERRRSRSRSRIIRIRAARSRARGIWASNTSQDT